MEESEIEREIAKQQYYMMQYAAQQHTRLLGAVFKPEDFYKSQFHTTKPKEEEFTMKIRKQDGTVIDPKPSELAYRFRDLGKHDVFSFAGGKPDNVYIMGEGQKYFLISNGNEYAGKPDYNLDQPGTKADALVILYPDAILDLGAPKREKDPKPEKVKYVMVQETDAPTKEETK